MSDKELLFAISTMMDSKLKPVNQSLAKAQEEIGSIKREIRELRGENAELTGEIAELKGEIAQMKGTVKKIEVIQENKILPRLQNIEACYTSTYHRYEKGSEEIEQAIQDLELMKGIITEHSDKIQKISIQ